MNTYELRTDAMRNAQESVSQGFRSSRHESPFESTINAMGQAGAAAAYGCKVEDLELASRIYDSCYRETEEQAWAEREEREEAES